MNSLTSHTILAVAASLAALPFYGQSTGSVAGAVVEDGISPLAGSTVTYLANGHHERDSHNRLIYVRPPIGGSVKSGSDGTFTISNLLPGMYIICAGGTIPQHVGSCGWTNATPLFQVSAGKVTSGLKLNVSRGTLLDIAIADPNGCVARNPKGSVNLFANSALRSAAFAFGAAGMIHYQEAVPQQTALRLTATHNCTFQDSHGNAITSATGLIIPPIQAENATILVTAR